MRYWVIADGDDGDQWEEFYSSGIVRMTGRRELRDFRRYRSLDDVRLALKQRFPDEFAAKSPARKARLIFNFANEVMVGDHVFIRHGRDKVLGYGLVEPPPTSTNSKPAAYFFNQDHPHFPHALRVRWLDRGDFRLPRGFLLSRDFISLIQGDRLNIIKNAVGWASKADDNLPLRTESLSQGLLLEDAYPRASPATLKTIIPRHKRLSNCFRDWLKSDHGIETRREENRVDVDFNYRKRAVLAELKVCYGLGTTKSIREALGQLLEYNHYPARHPYDLWLIVLDTEPCAADRRFVENLCKHLSMPLSIGWQTKEGFSFQPSWVSA